jgi:histidine ammonia-lyase
MAENKQRAMPCSLDSIPTSANQEDHVSMACHGARRLAEMNHNLAHIIAIELLVSVQGVEFRAPIETSARLREVMEKVRARVAALEEDRYLANDIAAIKQMVMDRSIIASLGEIGLLPQLDP